MEVPVTELTTEEDERLVLLELDVLLAVLVLLALLMLVLAVVELELAEEQYKPNNWHKTLVTVVVRFSISRLTLPVATVAKVEAARADDPVMLAVATLVT